MRFRVLLKMTDDDSMTKTKYFVSACCIHNFFKTQGELFDPDVF
jgi:hypothetical protein